MIKQTDTKIEKSVGEKDSPQEGYSRAVGRRKSSVARVRIYKTYKEGLSWGDLQIKKGDIVVNQKPIDQYFSGVVSQAIYTEPLRTTNTLGKITVTVKVAGGGLQGQLDAFVHGLSRALAGLDTQKYRPILKKKGFLTRDARVRERRKVGMGGKARRKRQSPKR